MIYSKQDKELWNIKCNVAVGCLSLKDPEAALLVDSISGLCWVPNTGVPCYVPISNHVSMTQPWCIDLVPLSSHSLGEGLRHWRMEGNLLSTKEI